MTYSGVMLYLAVLLSAITLAVIEAVILLGQPPRHCHYFVPVVGKPGIYSCSEYPRPVRLPKR